MPKTDAPLPNVLVVLIDDMGFGASSVYGGPCGMPAAERLAYGGLLYTRFHPAATGSSTRQALLTGRDQPSAATYHAGHRPDTTATIARMLKHHGYATAAFGKMPQRPKTSEPYEGWPTGDGFEKFYGFVGGETSQWEPTLFDGVRPVLEPGRPETRYHLSEDLAGQAVQWIRTQQARSPGTPFFVYLSFGATQAPHHVPWRWRERYRGRFEDGWDAQSQRTLRRQKALGLVPAHVKLPPRPDGVPRWGELTMPSRRLAVALMENYAGFASHTDRQAGRVVDALHLLGALGNTMIFYVLGDRGNPEAGRPEGTVNDFLGRNGMPAPTRDALARIDEIGGPESYPNYPAGWAAAMGTPFARRTGLIVHWPDGIGRRRELRHQWQHCADIVPTILDAAGLPEPRTLDGVAQQPIQGVSMCHTFDAPDAPARRVPRETRGARLSWPSAGRLARRSSMVFHGGARRLPHGGVPDVKNTSHAITAHIEVGADGGGGVIAAQGGRFGGWALYVVSGLVVYCYNLSGRERTHLHAPSPLPSGRHHVRFEFAYDGGGRGTGGTGTLAIDGVEVAAGRIEATVPSQFSSDQMLGIGLDSGSPVSDEYATLPRAFTGTIHSLRIEVGLDHHRSGERATHRRKAARR
ncbi:sulfatase-like hydrolase/transferase [Nonomuraea lactucae]|uniref:sulfatase-like hydrolase/transferase n=1 Tax=Nonomuraea lactucae TaxID=2249762 RepID=UPI000DE1E0B1|nr:sulfatase-like hydrolase/transferase [Nonomuraea lactucae]